MSKARKTCSLFEREAQDRQAKVESGSVHYQVFLLLQKGESYEGYMHVSMNLKDTLDIFLDYCGDDITSLRVNGQVIPVTDEVTANSRIHLPAANLMKDDTNIAEIGFKNRYHTDGNGLHTFTDVDGSQYLYIQSEPFWNNRVLPLFDQPDIKAHFSLVSIMENEWTLITSEDPELTQNWGEAYQPLNGIFHNKYFGMYKEKNLPAEMKLVIYKKSKLLPSYLFSFACGPYTYFELPEEKRYKNIPMKVYCRNTMKQFLEHQVDQFFDCHKLSIEFYEETFGLDYMFNKCDAIICPEFTIGGMEYPGSITYAEALFARGKPSIREVSLCGNVAMHEVSHMWFGDCVTPIWWNDTWLKESFADYVSYLCASKRSSNLSFKIEDPWMSFLQRKNWGYSDDSKSTTHPVSAQIRSTEEADGVFDGISYSKGAACMKQLVSVVGLDNWSKAMKVYFERYAWKNAKLDDLINVYQEVLNGEKGSHLDMIKWKDDWLETPGTNTVRAEWTNESNTIKFFQGAVLEQYPKLRYHKMIVTVLDENVEVVDSKEIILNDTELTEVEFSDMSRAKAVLLNDEDLDFIKVSLDDRSTEYFKANINRLKSQLSKAIVYKSFYDMVNDAKMKASDFIDFVVKNYNDKDSEALNNFAMAFFKSILGSYLKDSDFRQKSSEVFDNAFNHYKAQKGGPFKVLNLGLMLEFAYTNDQIDILKALYDAARTGLISDKLSITNQWMIIKKLFSSKRYGHEEKSRYFDELYKSDNSDTKEIYKVKIQAVQADTDDKIDAILEKCMQKELPYSFKVLQYTLVALNDYHFSAEARARLTEKIYSRIDELTSDRARSVAKSYMAFAFPKIDDLSKIEQHIKDAIGRLKSENMFAFKVLTQKLEDVQVVMKSRSVF